MISWYEVDEFLWLHSTSDGLDGAHWEEMMASSGLARMGGEGMGAALRAALHLRGWMAERRPCIIFVECLGQLGGGLPD